jgi:pilus assembly protein CpaF
MFAIVVNEKGGDQKRLEFDRPEVTIGRVQGNDIILPKGNVSKRHSRIVLKDGKFIIVDLKSTNGTYVNGRKITSPLVVKGSDKIYIGDFILSIEELGAAAAADEPAAAPRKPTPTIPPPPPRRAQPEAEASPAAADGADDHTLGTDEGEDQEDEAMEPPPARPARPAPAVERPAPAAPAARPAPAVARPAPIVPPVEAPRPVVRTDPPAAAPRPAPVAAPRPAPAAARPAPAPVARPAPAPAPVPRRPPASSAPASAAGPSSVEEQKRAKISELLRALSSRLFTNLGLDSEDPTVAADENLWARAESAAAELLNELTEDGGLPSGATEDALVRDAVGETLGAGPLDELLADGAVREISIPRHDRIFVDQGGRPELHARWFSSPEALRRAIERLLAKAGRAGELSNGAGHTSFIEARIDGGLLLSAALPPLAARGPSLTIRRPRRDGGRMTELVGHGVMSQGMADFLELAVRGRRNIIVSGVGGSGRTTVLAALARAAEGERVVLVEEAEEIDLGEGQWTTLISRGPAARDAIHAAMRLRPERLVVGDVRGPEAFDVVGALAGGPGGTLCAVTAGSARDAVARLETLAHLAKEAPARAVLADEIARNVHLVVQVQRSAEGEVRVVEIAEIGPGDAGAAIQPVFSAAGSRFSATGHVPAWAEGAPPSMFRG